MAFCGKCGSKLEDGVTFCPACGASSETPPPDTDRQTTPTYTPSVVPGAPGQADIRDAQDNKVLAVIGIINASKGEMKPLPGIGGISILK